MLFQSGSQSVKNYGNSRIVIIYNLREGYQYRCTKLMIAFFIWHYVLQNQA